MLKQLNEDDDLLSLVIEKMLGVNVKIAGVVLAGGQSLRMGKDKAILTIEHRTLLSRAVSLLKNAGIDDCYVSGNYDDFNCILDQHSSLGPIAGIEACSAQLSIQFDAIFIIPVDMPLLAVEDCHYLMQHFLKSNEGQSHNIDRQGVYYEDVTFPMILSLNDTLANYLAEVVTSHHKKHRSLYRLLKSLDIKGINRKECDAFRFENTNTPEQWQQCLSTYAAMHSKN
ncbi:molybdenum cofactor guanylyltransferase [Psychromonas sp.]|nr:molybdenum cofactor guanylyltransferase [Psychromonas sp.]